MRSVGDERGVMEGREQTKGRKSAERGENGTVVLLCHHRPLLLLAVLCDRVPVDPCVGGMHSCWTLLLHRIIAQHGLHLRANLLSPRDTL